MAHGAGGKATQSLIEGLLVPGVRLDGADALGDAGASSRRRRLALTTDSFVVKPLRFPGGSIGELAVNGTVNDLAVAGARPLALSALADPRGGARRRRAARRGRRRSPRAARGRRRRDRRRRHEGRRARPRRRHVHLHDRHRPARPARARSSPDALRPGDRVLLSGRDRRRTARRSCSRAASSSSTPTIESDTRSLWPAVDALLDAAGPALRCMRDATRGGVASVLNELARASGVGDARARGGGAGRRRRSPAPARCSASTRCTSPTRASSWRSSRRSAPTRRWPRCARVRAARRPRRSARCRTEPPGMVLVETALRRPAGDGPARRRPAAEDLLMHELSIADGDRGDRRCAHAGGRRVTRVEVRGRPPAPGGARARSSSPSSW